MPIQLANTLSLAFLGERWSPGIGDPSAVGWLTVAAYFVCSWMCWRARKSASAESRRVQLAWLILAAGTFLLGLNKQLDLQSLLTQTAKDMAKDGGWYADRRAVQVWFIRGILLGGGVAIAAGAWAMRKHARTFLLPGLGAVFIVAFVMIRAASFHHVDEFLRSGPLGLRMNWVLELGGIWLMAWGARRYERDARDRVARQVHAGRDPDARTHRPTEQHSRPEGLERPDSRTESGRQTEPGGSVEPGRPTKLGRQNRPQRHWRKPGS